MARREEILNAAQKAFLKYGIEKITLDDIALECGVKKTALYYYFKNKDELLAEMILLKLNGFMSKLQEAVGNAGNVQEKLRTYMKMKIEIMRENMPFFKLFEREHLPLKTKNFLQTHKTRVLELDFGLVKDVIKQGIDNQRVNFELSDSLVLMILGVTYGTFIGRFMEHTEWDIDEMIDTSIEVIFKGIE